MAVKTAEHFLCITTRSPWVRDWFRDKFHADDSPGPMTEDRAEMSVHVEDGYGTAFQGYEVQAEEKRGQTCYRRMDYRIATDAAYRLSHVSVHDELALKHAMTNLYSAFIIHREWGLLLHSACVVRQGRAYLFAGPSGAGKSTVARLSHPLPVLSDEAALVKVSPGRIEVYDSPFRSDVESKRDMESCGLAGIHLLAQSDLIRRVEIRKSEAILSMLRVVFYWAHNRGETAKVLHMCKTIVESVPVYRLFFQKNDAFWERIP